MFSANFVSGKGKKTFLISGLKKKTSQLRTAVSSIGKKDEFALVAISPPQTTTDANQYPSIAEQRGGSRRT